MELLTYKGQYFEYCDALDNGLKCLSPANYYFTVWHQQFSFSEVDSLIMELFDKKPFISFINLLHVFFTIVTIVIWMALSRIVTQKLYSSFVLSLTKRFLIEFLIISIPCIFCVQFINELVELIVFVALIFVGIVMLHSSCLKNVSLRTYILGPRPHFFSLLRSTVYIWTVLCILAIDFNSFREDFRKNRSYGASLMDVGIGLFITVMAMVSKRVTNRKAWKNILIAVVVLLVLGSLRTFFVMKLNYGQDDHEYGRHLNAFFILGFTKFFGSGVSFLASTDMQLLPLSIGIIALHELILQAGVQDYVINPIVNRDTLLDANREGFSSILGFVGLYLFCLYIYKMLDLKSTLTYNQMYQKLKILAGLSITMSFLTVVSNFTIGISRVTCNFGYIMWMVSLTLTMTFVYIIVFDVMLNTLLPIPNVAVTSEVAGDTAEQALLRTNDKQIDNFLPIPVLVDAVNMNGLVYFMIGNILTGFVNIFLNPDDRDSLETFVILTIYLLVTTGIVFILYKYKIRIA